MKEMFQGQAVEKSLKRKATQETKGDETGKIDVGSELRELLVVVTFAPGRCILNLKNTFHSF